MYHGTMLSVCPIMRTYAMLQQVESTTTCFLRSFCFGLDPVLPLLLLFLLLLLLLSGETDILLCVPLVRSCCLAVLLSCCLAVLLSCCLAVLLCCCVAVLLCCCVAVLLS